MNVVLIGFKASGKSTVGRLVAARLGLAFVDLDDGIEALARAQSGRALTCRQLYQEQGEAAFRQLESQALRELAGRSGMVLATGGGAPMNCANNELLRRLGVVVYLRVRPELIWARLQVLGLPPWLQGDPSFANLRENWRTPDAVCFDLAEITIEVGDLAPAAAAAAVIAQLEKPTCPEAR